MMAYLGPKHVAEWILHEGYRCVRWKTIVLCFNIEHIGTNKVKLKSLPTPSVVSSSYVPSMGQQC